MKMHLNRTLKNKNGVTLIELLIALVISALLIAALYRTFIGQQKTYVVQEQVVDTQQNVRVAINKMMRDIRMAGFGGVGDVLSQVGGVNGFTDVIAPNANSITIVGGFRQVSTLAAEAAGGQSQVTLASAADASQFDGAAHRFISIGGTESNIVSSRAGATLTLSNPLKLTQKITDKLGNPVSVPIFKIQAITYLCGVSDGKPVLQRNENTGGGPQPLAENIENIQFEYFDANGALTVNPANIRMVRATVTARTDRLDPDLKIGDGFRRRTIASNIYVRNMGLSP
jgi:prepilin-type N-terminal cleavage/methylation domain-containing protein